ncbi:hypothetical protein CO157_02165 [Candidatus Peregrinibacteria bacterium CG_4_9_14_3_um_filter_49_12]|nr:MAG: hypothetical protein COV83_04700 [Candidatus Peregrinibacteria bacterium CG11_big_fil_rev_8_21_14_0_20_49_14]PJA67940.1 MAG: hypothetical protein CO157_02165 [Candidatus Peregrinibacteria bacterium CG_4_9_14_3_um_filter_49_12]
MLGQLRELSLDGEDLFVLRLRGFTGVDEVLHGANGEGGEICVWPLTAKAALRSQKRLACSAPATGFS